MENTDNKQVDMTSDSDSDQEINPWKVTSKAGIDYMKLIDKFGCDPIDGELIKRFEQITRVKAHTWLRRGLFFSQKDLALVLKDYESGKPVYLYTGRGPSSEAMHMGHLIPFMFTKWLQYALDAVLVIQMSDDEKFHFKGRDEGKAVEEYNRLTYENAKDIIACGFNPEKTYIFSNFKTVSGELYANTVRLMKITGNQIRGIYGLNLDNTVGQISWPCFQCAPAYSNSFPDILHPDGHYSSEAFDGTKTYDGPHLRCLVPMAIDQDPYFRMARDFAHDYRASGYIKPATIHTKLLVGLGGIKDKMSSTGGSPTIYLTDDVKGIAKKIKKYAFSGGKETVELHQKYGGNLEVDVAYQWMLYFNHDDNDMKTIAHNYRSGKMLTGTIKNRCAEVVTDLIARHQEARAKITDDDMRKFFSRDREFNLDHSVREPVELESDEVYATYGINFDTSFGAVSPTSSKLSHISCIGCSKCVVSV